MPAGLPVRDMRRIVGLPSSMSFSRAPFADETPCPARGWKYRTQGKTMNREHYLSKRTQPSLQKPADRQVVPEEGADAGAEPARPAEPDEDRIGNAADTAKQETQSGR
jgi:hypothetical protein